MKRLDELEALAKKAGSDKHSDWLAFCEAVQNPATILAIAEAFRALEQRAEAAEAAFRENEQAKQQLFIERDKLLTANLRLGKQLAELEKQEPVVWVSQSELDLIRPTDRRCVEATLWGVQRFRTDVALYLAPPAPVVKAVKLNASAVMSRKYVVGAIRAAGGEVEE